MPGTLDGRAQTLNRLSEGCLHSSTCHGGMKDHVDVMVIEGVFEQFLVPDIARNNLSPLVKPRKEQLRVCSVAPHERRDVSTVFKQIMSKPAAQKTSGASPQNR